MDAADFWPQTGFFGIVLGGIVILDWIVKKEHKSAIFHWFLRVAQVSSRPVSSAFYVVIVITSILVTYGIIFVDARIAILTGRLLEAPSIQEVISPVLLGLIFKTLIWDYMLALKTFVFVKGLRGDFKLKEGRPGKRVKIRMAPRVLFITVDFVFTVTSTHFVFDSLESFQYRQVQSIAESEEVKQRTTPSPAPQSSPSPALQLTPQPTPLPSLTLASPTPTPESEEDLANAESPAQPAPPKSLLWRIADRLGLFDAIDFFSKDTLKLSWCLLNGTSLMYLFMLFSAAARGTVKHLNVEGITTHLFRIVVFLIGVCVAVVAAAGRYVAR